MARAAKLPFTHLPGLPSRDDPELNSLMHTVGRLPRASVEECVRNLFRVALAHRRTGDVEYLTCFAEDALVSMRLRGNPDVEQALNDAPTTPSHADDCVAVEEMLARRGL